MALSNQWLQEKWDQHQRTVKQAANRQLWEMEHSAWMQKLEAQLWQQTVPILTTPVRRKVNDNPAAVQYAAETYYVPGDYVKVAKAFQLNGDAAPPALGYGKLYTIHDITPEGLMVVQDTETGAIFPPNKGFGPNWFDHVTSEGALIAERPCYAAKDW